MRKDTRYRETTRRIGAAAAFVALCVPAGAAATTLLKLSVETMGRDAAAVVTGEAAERTTVWGPGKTTIHTYTTILVESCVAGACGGWKKATVKHRGGTMDGATLIVPGTPSFSQGEKVLLFLEADPEGEEGRFAVLGMCQGKFRIEKDAASGKLVATQDLGKVALAAPDQSGTIRITGKKAPIVMPLGKLIALVKKARAATVKK